MRTEMKSAIFGALEFKHASATLCGRMVSLDADTRRLAATEAEILLREMPKSLKHSPHLAGEISALNHLRNSILNAEGVALPESWGA